MTAAARFVGRAALVTGAAQGIGRATCERLVSEGAAVAVVDFDVDRARRTAAELEDAGGRAIAVACDVTSSEEVGSAVHRVAAELGRLDAVVCCAGIVRDALVHKLTEADWDAVVQTHLKGTFLVAQAAQRHMVAAGGGGSMVFLSSGSARGSRGQANYAAAKAGIEALARTLALELGRFGIRVNAVAPGTVETQMTHSTAERLGMSWDDFAAREASHLALGRIGQPADIAAVVAFFCSEDAGFVTGQTLYVRGAP